MYRDWNPFDHKLRAFTTINAQQNRAFLLTLLKTVGEDRDRQQPEQMCEESSQLANAALSSP